MPRISEFYGIAIYRYCQDHAPPHFHAIYAGKEAVFGIHDGRILGGELPARARRLVRDWARLHEQDLQRNWERPAKACPWWPSPPGLGSGQGPAQPSSDLAPARRRDLRDRPRRLL